VGVSGVLLVWFLSGKHILTIQNESGIRVEGLVVAIREAEQLVGPINPGESTTVTLRVNAESQWRVFLVRDGIRRPLGVCGYTGTYPGRPSRNDLRLIRVGEGTTRDCVITIG
jgi:hypothetical protein